MKSTLQSFLVLGLAITAEGIEPRKIDGFVRSVSDACESKDIGAIKNLTHYAGSHQILIDFNVAQWERYFKEYETFGLKFSNATFKGLDDLTKEEKKNYLDLEGEVLNGREYTYNLEPVGSLLVVYASSHSSSQVFLPVGVDPAGKLNRFEPGDAQCLRVSQARYATRRSLSCSLDVR